MSYTIPAHLAGFDWYPGHLAYLGYDLPGVEPKCADLTGADLTHANLSDADLSDANLSDADLTRADLSSANLFRANLRGANLRGANLRGADLIDAYLAGAFLIDAKLSCAKLFGANLFRANLTGADLTGASYDYITIGIHAAPEGTLIGYKKVNGAIIKLRIPEEATRSCATGRKHRAEYAKVLSITLPGGKEADTIINGSYGHETWYVVGRMVYPDSYCEDRWRECAPGIHFFLTRQEAETY